MIPTREQAIARIKANAEKDGRQLDPIDNFLIQMVQLLGVEVTDKYITGGENIGNSH